MKECSKCNIIKPLDRFCKDSKSKDGFQTQCKECKSLWARSNSSIIKRNRLVWSKNNTDKLKTKSLNHYHKNKVRHNVARMIRKALSTHTKSKPTFELLGYTVEDLKLHLEKQFVEGMSWNNYGEWHIDHIVPQSKLPYNTPDDDNFKKCWALSNLQPLWAVDNIKKSNKLIPSA